MGRKEASKERNSSKGDKNKHVTKIMKEIKNMH
jgi:hypothetical protein